MSAEAAAYLQRLQGLLEQGLCCSLRCLCMRCCAGASSGSYACLVCVGGDRERSLQEMEVPPLVRRQPQGDVARAL